MKAIIAALFMTLSAHADSAMESILTEDAIRGLRDPFRTPNMVSESKGAPKSDLELFPLKEIKLTGVISGLKNPKAMVSLPNSKSFFVSIGDRLGISEGKVISISGDSIKVVEYANGENGKKFAEVFKLSISGEINSLSEKKEEQ